MGFCLGVRKWSFIIIVGVDISPVNSEWVGLQLNTTCAIDSIIIIFLFGLRNYIILFMILFMD